MNKSAIIGTVFGITVATAAAGIAGYALVDSDEADVPATACYEQEVEVAKEPADDKRIAGTAVGAVVGGAVARDVGDRDLTTAVGAAVGALAGNQAQKKFQENRTETSVEVRCEPGS
jgi:uncharacterized protein YcfJ